MNPLSIKVIDILEKVKTGVISIDEAHKQIFELFDIVDDEFNKKMQSFWPDDVFTPNNNF